MKFLNLSSKVRYLTFNFLQDLTIQINKSNSFDMKAKLFNSNFFHRSATGGESSVAHGWLVVNYPEMPVWVASDIISTTNHILTYVSKLLN